MPSRRGFRHLAAALATAFTLALAADVRAADSPPARPADSRDDMISVLRAGGPHPSLGRQADLFGRFAGAWDADYKFIAEDGSVRQARGEVLVGWVLDGHALQDLWIDFPEPGSGNERNIGTTLRIVDPKSGKWQVVFVAPTANRMQRLEGGAEGDRIVLRGQREDGSEIRWSFNDVRPDTFVWRGELSRDGGKTWRLREEHHMRRRTGTGG